MRFFYPDTSFLIDTENGYINALIIENQKALYSLVSDIYNQINGEDGKSVVSKDNNPLDMSKNADLLTTFIPFDINKKSLLSKITAALEKNAVSESHFDEAMTILSRIEKYLSSLTFDFPCDIIFSKINIPTLIKSTSPELRDDYSSISEKVIDYFELVSEFDRNKLFFTLNMRSFISDKEAELFMSTVLSHGYNIIMIENREYEITPYEKRYIVDSDLCEIY